MINFTIVKKLLVIAGPTATGKTALALELAKKFNGEIISADSRQIYQSMDIGTGKEIKNAGTRIQKSQGKWIVDDTPIYLYDLVTPDKTFSVAQFQQLAYQTIGETHEKNKLPILVGGTGLYVRAVTEGLKIPKVAPNKKLRRRLESRSLASLLRELQNVDPETYEKIDKFNTRRVIRALEIYHQVGEPASKLKGKFKVNYDILKVGLTSNRNYLYERADKQVDNWFERGFIEEVRNLLKKGYRETFTSLTSLGYRQVVMLLHQKITLEESKQRIKWEQHSYIRRQITWFKKETNINWFDIAEVGFKKDIGKLVSRWL